MSDLEAVLEEEFCREVRKDRCIPIKGEFLGEAHNPDRLILTPMGKFYWIEFKRKGETTSPGQKLRTEELRALGHTVYVCDNWERALRHHKAEMGPTFW
jgi:hypothetical protein